MGRLDDIRRTFRDFAGGAALVDDRSLVVVTRAGRGAA